VEGRSEISGGREMRGGKKGERNTDRAIALQWDEKLEMKQ